jgi:hypothetical protein
VQTGGENFDRKSLVAATAHAGDNDKSAATRQGVDSESKEKEDENEIYDFFTKFEKTTEGENFQPGWL